MPKRIHETRTLSVESMDQSTGRLQLGVISPGWGSSGYYSPKVLENAATGRVFAKGTHCFLDHPSESEEHDRPERSVRDLAAVLAEDAYWDGTQLVAEAQVFKAYRELLTDPDVAQNIGVSIRAFADTTVGEAEGRKGTIITDLTEALSVDFVTKAGRGGRVLAVLESARAAVDEATANDTRNALEAALKAAYGSEKSYAWVRDFDETRVWFTVEDADSTTTYEHGYAADEQGAITLAHGDPTEVRARTEYVPVTPAAEAAPDVPAPAGQSTATESKETNMATIQIEETELGRLRQDAERVQTLESERDAATAERDQARTALAVHTAREAARPAIARAVAESGLPARRQARLVESILAGVSVDTTPETVAEATARVIADEQADIAELAESLGVGTVSGFGQSVTESTGYGVDDFDAAFTARKEG